MILLMYLDMSNRRSSLFFFTCHFSFVVNQSFQTFTFNFKKYIYVSNKIFMFICSLWQINTFIKYNLHVLKLNKFLKLMVKDENIWLRRKLIRYVKKNGWSISFNLRVAKWAGGVYGHVIVFVVWQSRMEETYGHVAFTIVLSIHNRYIKDRTSITIYYILWKNGVPRTRF